MIRLLVKKSIRESRALFLACGALLMAFCLGRIWIVCQFDLQKFEPLLRQFSAFEKYMPVPLEQLLTYSGSMAMTFNEPMLILAILVWSVSRGSDVVSGELGRGTLEMLLTQPVSRVQLVICHVAISTLGLALLCFVTWLAFYVGILCNSVPETVQATASFRLPLLPIDIPVPLGEATEVRVPLAEKVDALNFAPACVNLFSFGFVVLGISTLFSCLDRFRWRAIGMALAVYVVQVLLFMVSLANESWKWVENITFLSYYQPDRIVLLTSRGQLNASLVRAAEVSNTAWPSQLSPWGLSLSLILLSCILIAAGTLIFRRRDLPAPL